MAAAPPVEVAWDLPESKVGAGVIWIARKTRRGAVLAAVSAHLLDQGLADRAEPVVSQALEGLAARSGTLQLRLARCIATLSADLTKLERAQQVYSSCTLLAAERDEAGWSIGRLGPERVLLIRPGQEPTPLGSEDALAVHQGPGRLVTAAVLPQIRWRLAGDNWTLEDNRKPAQAFLARQRCQSYPAEPQEALVVLSHPRWCMLPPLRLDPTQQSSAQMAAAVQAVEPGVAGAVLVLRA